MDVFISWSGDRSRAVADLLDDWLQCVLQAIDPWMSSKDIDRGSLWFTEISNQLSQTKVGIVCLTRDNIDKPWILFEAGALAKGLSSARVCTFLVDLEATDISDPLAQFNHTSPTQDGLFELVRTLNNALGEKALKDKVLAQVFETYWPQFEADFNKALKENPTGHAEEIRTDASLLTELLKTTRSLDRRMRGIERSVEPNENEKDANRYLFYSSHNSNFKSERNSMKNLAIDHSNAIKEMSALLEDGVGFDEAKRILRSQYSEEVLDQIG